MTCKNCSVNLASALRHAATVRAPVGDRALGPYETEFWKRAQAAARADVAQALAGLRECPVA